MKKVIVYSTNPCPKCRMLKETILKRKNIDFEEIYIPNAEKQREISSELEKAQRDGDFEKAIDLEVIINEAQTNIDTIVEVTGKRVMPTVFILDSETDEILDTVSELDMPKIKTVFKDPEEFIKINDKPETEE